MPEPNSKKILDLLKNPKSGTKGSASKKDPETVVLGKIYNFLIKDREEKTKRQIEVNRIQKQSDIQEEFTPQTVSPDGIPSATPAPKKDKKDNGMFGGLALLGIVAAGAGVFVFSDEIKEKIDELKNLFEESTWMDAFHKFEELFDFSDMAEKLGINEFFDLGEDISQEVEEAAEISGFDEKQLNILTEGGKTMLSEEEFKQIQSQHKELEGKSFTDVEANIAAQGFKAKDIQQQLGTTDIAQTYAAEKLGVETTKKLYAASDTASAADIAPEVAKSQRDIFYDESGKARTVAQVKERFAQQTSGRPTGTVEEILATIRNRESSNNYASPGRPGRTASGAYQFIDDTWQSLSKTVPGAEQYAHASDAPPAIQDAVARKYVTDILKKSGNDITAVPRVWYTGNLQGKLSAKALAANKGYTVERYVEHWMQDYQKVSGKGGGMGHARDTGLVSTQVSPSIPELQAPTSTGGNISGLQFAPGVDPGISAAISNKMRAIQNVFGKRLVITSGFRSPERNSKVGGAKNSAHMRGNAVDISTNGMSTDEKVKLIQVASAIGIGGIGVYTSGALHFDIEGRRAWGDDYHLTSLPQWASGVIAGHLQGKYLGSLQNIQSIEQSVTSTTPTVQSPQNIPTPERKPSSKTNNTVVIQQNQVNTSITKRNMDISSPYKDLKPQDIINAGIRGY